MSDFKPITMCFENFDEALRAAELLTPSLHVKGYEFAMTPLPIREMWKAEIKPMEKLAGRLSA